MYRRRTRKPLSFLLLSTLVVLPASSVTTQELTSRSELTPEERTHYEKLFDKWRNENRTLFIRLRESVQKGDSRAAYFILKEFHGGGAGVEGAKFELMLAEADEKRRLLKGKEGDLEGVQILEIEKSKYPPELVGLYQNLIDTKKEEIADLKGEIQEMDKEAEALVEASVVKELAEVFEIMTNKPSSDS